MAHQSLYRKYRPQTFTDVVGQSHITRTLRNAVAEGSVAHAYLFTGPRGTGKTTTARILAKALECEKGPTPDPDTTCQQCIDIAEGRHPDVHELDAASRTQVENVREEIIGRVAYLPTVGAWKVYIIDEVHMLSTHSFNALLKTIEEPPANTVFMLCTTHPHKVPDTIHSRCQRFDFHRIGIEDLVGRLRYIAQAEGIEVPDAALTIIAKHAAGGMRDAISTLEQLAAFTSMHIGIEDVEGLLGEVDAALLFELAGLVARRDVAGAFGFVARLAEAGTDMAEFVREFTGHVRDLYVTAAVGDPSGVVDATHDALARLSAQANEFGIDRLARVLDLLGQLSTEIRWTPNPRLALEVSLTRMARPHGDLTLEALAERMEALERGVPATRVVTSAAPQVSAPRDSSDAISAAPEATQDARGADREDSPAALVVEPVEVEEAEPVPPKSEAGRDRASVKRAWPAVLAEVKKIKATRVALLSSVEIDLDSDGETLVLEFPQEQEFTMQLADEPDTKDILRAALAAVFGEAPPYRYQLGRGAVRPSADQTVATVPGAARATAEPTVEPLDAGIHAPAEADDGEAERLLLEELGAEMVGEHSNEHDSD